MSRQTLLCWKLSRDWRNKKISTLCWKCSDWEIYWGIIVPFHICSFHLIQYNWISVYWFIAKKTFGGLHFLCIVISLIVDWWLVYRADDVASFVWLLNKIFSSQNQHGTDSGAVQCHSEMPLFQMLLKAISLIEPARLIVSSANFNQVC